MRGALLLLGCLLLFDAATPLLPGAFRFDPAESVEALHGPDRPRAQAAAPRVDVAAPRAPRALAARSRAVLNRARHDPPRLDVRRAAVGTHARDDGAASDDD